MAMFAPRASAALEAAQDAVRSAVAPALLDAVRDRVRAQLAGGAAEPGDPALALVDQFVLYVPAVSEEHLAPVRKRFGPDGLRTFVEALYVVDQTERLGLAYERLFPSAEAGSEGGDQAWSEGAREVGHTWSDQAGQTSLISSGRAAERLRASLTELHAEAMLLDRLEPLTTELVRLRCADYHDCAT
jgi:hypothetical protein